MCQTSAHELESAAKALEQSYQSAGEGWNDEKYRQLGTVISSCTSALRSPISSLQSCEGRLNQLLKAVEAYESINI